ncbi:hypothetical protein ARMSODRAFT_953639 [Armillaria solidipes]|uniref:VWFA domain-containing protein n=1 Tax=Armillaria solidipes TaxID=1076256 RepID=A0A2H3C4B3_9AGAR|nr:hypothetical protein ARMSODRAFT_953639 [Armillaria solidipes]
MGNSSSARYKDTDIPPKFSVRVLPDDSDMVHRSRDSAHAAPNPGHRRSRSANATVRRSNADDIPPPPPYSRTPPRLDTQLLTPSHSSSNLNLNHLYQFAGQRHSSSQPSSPSRTNRRRSINFRTPYRQQSLEDALEMLRKFDTVIVLDDSSSMLGPSWTEATEALSNLADMAGRYDDDGIDIYFLNDPKFGRNIKTDEQVRALLSSVSPKGVTPIGGRLDDLLGDYLHLLESKTYEELKHIKHRNYIVITDGQATDDPATVIAAMAKRLDNGNFPQTQVGIQFIQIGKSSKAARYLRELDDDLRNKFNIRDMVDTTEHHGQLTGEYLIKALIGGINRRVDNHGGSAVIDY